MKRLLFLLSMMMVSLNMLAQLEIKEGSFKEVPGFVNINPDANYQTDDNDLPFAVIKVRTENITDKQRRELRFEGNGGTFIMLEYKTGEVWVYVTAKYADYLKISHPDLSSVEYWLPIDLKPRKGYELTLVNLAKSDIDEDKILDLIDKRLETTTKPATEVAEPEVITKDGYWFLTLNTSIDKYGELAYGLTFGSVNRFGWFASLMTNFDFNGFSTEYECSNDFMVGTYYPDYSGNEYYTSFSATAGLIYKIVNPIALRLGVGYGVRNTVYETTDGKMVKNVDLSVSGLDASLGVQLKLGGFVMSVDAVTTNFKTIEAKMGLGFGLAK